MSHIASLREYLDGLKTLIDGVDISTYDAIVEALYKTVQDGKKVITMGNGGSASTASHFCCDLNKGSSFGFDKKFRAICLSDNQATMMAFANDSSYEEVFVGPLRNFLEPGDVVVGFSGSGNSQNVIKAINYSNEKGNYTIGVSGYDGGLLKKASQCSFHIPSFDMQKVEDLHVVLTHALMQSLCSLQEANKK